MARPHRNDVDYFPHKCTHGRKMYIIESKYGNDGYAVWFKLLEQLGLAQYHYLDLRDSTQKMYLSSLMKVDQDKFESIILDLANLEAINKELYLDHSIVWSDQFIESIEDAYSRRSNKCMNLQGLCSHLTIKRKHKHGSKSVNSDKKPQRIVKDSKEEDKKEKNIPSKEEFLSYALSKKPNVDTESVNLKYDSWVLNDWKDGNNNQIKNWKVKLNNTLPYLKESKTKQVFSNNAHLFMP